MTQRWVGLVVVVVAVLAATAEAAAPPGSKTVGRDKLAERDRHERLLAALVRAKEPDAERILQVAKRIAQLEKEVLGEGHQETIGSLQRLANLHGVLNQFEKAAKVCAEVLRLQEKRFGKGHWEVTNARIALADAEWKGKMTPVQWGKLVQANAWNEQVVQLVGQGKAKEAIALAVEVRQILEEILGKKHPDCATSLNNLAVLHSSMGENAKALPLYLEALKIREEILGKKHPDCAASLNNLAVLHESMGENAKALPLFLEALKIREEILGKKHPDYAASLNNLANLHESMGENAKALPVFLEALKLREEVLGKKHPDYAASLSGLALLHFRMGENAKALPLYLEALKIKEEILGKKHPHYALSLNNLAVLHSSMGENAKALPLYLEALKIREEILGKKHPDYAASLNNLAHLHESMGENAKALPLFLEALKLREEVLGKKHPDYATSLNGLALLHSSMGENAKALPLVLEALKIREEILGKKHPDYATSLNNLAGLHSRMGENVKALPLYLEALKITEEILGKKHPDYADSLNNLAGLHQSMGENAKALPLYLEALKIREVVLGKKHPDYANSLHNLALLHESMGENAKALPLFLEAMKIYEEVLGKTHPDFAQSLNNLAHLHESMGENAKALPLYLEALKIREVVLGKKHPDYAQSLHNLALLHESMGENAKALTLFLEAQKITEEILGKNHPDYATSLNNLAVLHESMGENAKALTLFLEAQKITEEVLGKKHPHYATSLNNLAVLHSRMGKPKEAVKVSAQALEVLEHHLDDGFDLLGERQRNQALQNVLHNLGALLTLQEQAEVPATQRYAAVLAWKGRVASYSALDRLAADRPELKQSLGELQSARARLTRLTLQTPSPAQQSAWLKQIQTLTDAKETLDAELARRSAEFRQRQQLARLTPEQLAKQLPDGLAFVDLLEYSHLIPPEGGKGKYTAELRLLAFVSRPGKEVVLLPLGAAKPVSDAVARWRAAVEKAPSDLSRKALAAEASRLREKVWLPIARHLGDAKTVVVAPDGALCQFPLAALPGAKAGTYLIEEIAIAQVASGAQLVELLRPVDKDAKVGKGLLAAGGIDYGKGRSYPALPGTGPEATRCRELFRKAFDDPATLLSGSEATPQTLRKHLANRPRYLHLATHGYFEPAEKVERLLKGLAAQKDAFALHQQQRITLSNLPGLRCGLALSGANALPPENDPDALPNVLTGQDLEAIDLRGCDLAVLSACQTALGDVKRSQGVLGLQRAFHAAGVRTTVTSLWKVNDAATLVLMEEFYSRLWGKQKIGRLEALRQTQLWLLRNPDAVRKRAAVLLASARRSGAPEAILRGLADIGELPDGGKIEDKARRSPEAWWAAFVLSGDWR